MMTLRPNIDVLLKTLRCEPAAYIPVAELGIAPQIKSLFLGKAIRTLADEIEFWTQAGYDYVKIQPEVKYQIGGRLTALGDDSQREWATEEAGLITSWDAFESYPFPTPEDVSYRRLDAVRDVLPEGLGVVGQYGDIFTLTWELMGLENFSFALFENPDLVRAINDRVGRTILSMFERFAQDEAVDILWYSDDIAFNTGLLMSPEVLEQVFFPWLDQIGALARAAGKPLIYHSDGVLFDVLDRLQAAGISALHPIEPKAMDIREVRRRASPGLALIGNVDVGDVLTRGTPTTVREQVRRNIEWMGGEPGYCLGSGNSIPEYVPLDNYRALLEAAFEFGGGR
ncbi:MAG: nucleoside 2-deoxyribosyltransferase [Candidatus Neomarinimicrobiota bacterium]|nr:MAG: nucleoside 2-deoxyribosyltransferase [Candidatus Neomarinimicrobiota bacterium]